MAASKVTCLLEAIQHGDYLLSAVEELVRQSRAMMEAFERGEPELYSSTGMRRALAPFEDWNPKMSIRN